MEIHINDIYHFFANIFHYCTLCYFMILPEMIIFYTFLSALLFIAYTEPVYNKNYYISLVKYSFVGIFLGFLYPYSIACSAYGYFYQSFDENMNNSDNNDTNDNTNNDNTNDTNKKTENVSNKIEQNITINNHYNIVYNNIQLSAPSSSSSSSNSNSKYYKSTYKNHKNKKVGPLMDYSNDIKKSIKSISDTIREEREKNTNISIKKFIR